jgi:hypothetical protein
MPVATATPDRPAARQTSPCSPVIPCRQRFVAGIFSRPDRRAAFLLAEQVIDFEKVISFRN